MNKLRRNNLATAIMLIRSLQDLDLATEMPTFAMRIRNAEKLVDTALEGERDYFDNMPEGFQNGDRGIMAEQAIEQLETAQQLLTAIVEDHNTLGEHEEDIVLALEEAQG